MKKSLLAVIGSAALLSGCATVYPEPFVPIAPINIAPPAKAPTATAGVSVITRLTNDPAPELMPRVSEDKSTVLVTVRDMRKSGSESLSIVSFNVNNPGRRLIAGPYAGAAAWIEGNQIVYSYLRGSKPVLVKQNLNANGMRFISPAPFGESDQMASFNSASDKLSFQTSIGGVLHIATVDLDGRNFTVYVEGEYPSWMPDGKSISFHRNVGNTVQIFMLNLKDGSVTQLTSGASGNKFASISPSGKHIAFVSDRDGKDHIYTMRANGSELRQVTSGDTQEAFPTWLGESELLFSSDAGAMTPVTGRAYQWDFADIWKAKLK